ncbi:unnamed protein product [Bursaphelenchus okinawaensis]|uniref:BTB domain-containing protein n=1 Tax=Bursaphelenchus okinawaensis TaxID=465554 RepID=A0A811L3V4_9BILA|nr:unnamed protein product [Bursaphelenchus okinawaensis]CAG9118845.1 unnamed protein product [Bursaphelenchus okinawaensis]
MLFMYRVYFDMNFEYLKGRASRLQFDGEKRDKERPGRKDAFLISRWEPKRSWKVDEEATPPTSSQPVAVGRKVQIHKTSKAPEVSVLDTSSVDSGFTFGSVLSQPKFPTSFSVNPNTYLSSRSSALNVKGQAFNEPKLSDFQIKVGTRTFYVSKMVLAANSKVFHRMFMTDCNEVDAGFMVMQDCEPAAVEAMLFYMFEKKSVDEDLARDVMLLADKYQMSELKDQCEIKLGSTLKLDNLEDRISLAYNLRASNLLKKCFKFGADQFDSF